MDNNHSADEQWDLIVNKIHIGCSGSCVICNDITALYPRQPGWFSTRKRHSLTNPRSLRVLYNIFNYFVSLTVPATVHTHTHTHLLFTALWILSGITGWAGTRTNLDFTEARDSEWQWHQLGHMQIYTLPQTDSHASTPPPSFYRPHALPAAQPTASKHWRHRFRPQLICFIGS